MLVQESRRQILYFRIRDPSASTAIPTTTPIPTSSGQGRKKVVNTNNDHAGDKYRELANTGKYWSIQIFTIKTTLIWSIILSHTIIKW